MDPTAAWNTMIDETNDVDERVEAAEALRGWLDSGGFGPRTREWFDVDRIDGEIARVLLMGGASA